MQNSIADALAKAASSLKIPMNSNNKFEIHVKHRPTIPDNQRYWQVFQDDEEIKDFLLNKGKFKETSIDAENDEGKGNGLDEAQINEMDILL